MGLFDSLFGSESETTSRPALNRRERELQKLNLELAQASQPLSLDLIRAAEEDFGRSRALIGSEFDRANRFRELVPAAEEAETDVARRQRVIDLGDTGQGLLNDLISLVQEGPALTDEQRANLAEQADIAIGRGLSDLDRFREQTFEDVRQSAASRGLRPSDVPIVNRLTDLGEQLGRQAQSLSEGIRAEQLRQELDLPFRNYGAQTGGLSLASDLANRERAFENALAGAAEAQRLGLSAAGTSLAGGVTSANAPGATFSQVAVPGVTSTTSSTPPLGSIIGSLLSSRTLGSPTPSGGASLPSGGGGGAGGGALSSIWGGIKNVGSGIYSAGSSIGSGIGSLFSSIGSFFSDEELKELLGELDSKAILDQIRAVEFEYLDPEQYGEGRRPGILAQDLLKAGLAHAVERDEEGRLKVDATQLSGAMMGLLADMNKRLSEVEAQDG